MSDPIIDALQFKPRLLVLTAKGYSPISIRDQMVRADWLIQRALKQQIIKADNGRVLVVGTGAAGVTAAVRCAEQGVDTLIVERKSQPFLRQAGSATRWLDPFQYDWPADQWSATSYPRVGGVPLPWDADLSYRLAIRWRMVLMKAISRLPLRCQFNTWPVAIHPSGPSGSPVELQVRFNSPSAWQPFQAVIWAAGFGEEICTIEDLRRRAGVKYTSPSFWSSDQLEKKACGSTVPKPEVVILGAGDGGVQDCLRALTKRKSARAIVQDLEVPPDILQAVQSAEERAHRHWIWAGTDGRHDHELYQSLDNTHRQLAAAALAHQVVQDKLRELLGDPAERENVRLLHRCDHLVCLYGLNRFLVLLLDLYLKEFESRQLLFPRVTVVDVDTTKFPYVLDCVQHPVCFDPVNLSAPNSSMLAHVIIVRYGLDVSSVVPPASGRLTLPRYRHSIACDRNP